jgi:hypothetical protein
MGFLGNFFFVFPNVFPYGSFMFSPKCPMFIYYYVPNLFLKFPIAHFIRNVLPKILLTIIGSPKEILHNGYFEECQKVANHHTYIMRPCGKVSILGV